MRNELLESIKEIIKNEEQEGVSHCGLYFTENIAGDPMETIKEYPDEGVTVDVCYSYDYFEVFGLTEEEQQELYVWYKSNDPWI